MVNAGSTTIGSVESENKSSGLTSHLTLHIGRTLKRNKLIKHNYSRLFILPIINFTSTTFITLTTNTHLHHHKLGHSA